MRRLIPVFLITMLSIVLTKNAYSINFLSELPPNEGRYGTGYFKYESVIPNRTGSDGENCVPAAVLKENPTYTTTMYYGHVLQLNTDFIAAAKYWESTGKSLAGTSCEDGNCSVIQIGDISRKPAFVGDDLKVSCHDGHNDGIRFDVRYQSGSNIIGKSIVPFWFAIRKGGFRGDYVSFFKSVYMAQFLISNIHIECFYVYDYRWSVFYPSREIGGAVFRQQDDHFNHMHFGVKRLPTLVSKKNPLGC